MTKMATTKKKTDGKRSQKVAEALRGELMSMLLAGEVHDPGVQMATVSAVVLTDDLRLAKVYVRTLNLDADEKTKSAMVKALERAKGYLRRGLAQRLALRYAPDLRFYYDEAVDRGREIEALLRTIEPSKADVEPAQAGSRVEDPRAPTAEIEPAKPAADDDTK
jgi:ribosome-binding factor A